MNSEESEKMLCKVLVHNKILEQSKASEAIAEKANWQGTLPQYLINKHGIKDSVMEQVVSFVKKKGGDFESSQVNSPSSAEDASQKKTNTPSENLQANYSEANTQPAQVDFAKPNDLDPQLTPQNLCRPKGIGETLIKLLLEAKELGASDLHFTPDTPIFARIRGALHRFEEHTLNAQEIEALVEDILEEQQYEDLIKYQQLDFSLELQDQSRYRACIVKERTGYSGCFRIVDKEPPNLDELGLPPQAKTLTEYATGLVLVTGPMGSGKTSTLAAMVDLINKSRKDHIITLEDPIEFRHYGKGCQVSQRSLNGHTLSYANALRGALRQDPDVILVGELRDLDTIAIAITAAETGHLVLGSLHTNSASRTIDRIVNSFPPDQQAQIRVMVADSFRGIICQELVPKKDDSGMALAYEILMNNTSVRKSIVDNRTFMLESAMQTGKKQGMIRMDDCIKNLLEKGVISRETAKKYARNPSEIK
ncbi:MAG: PilT/PilU family type 4a pilus ATPase [Planctomycetes bacterium]|nr:PilT/PilU family type 4a pilus ATPase [Planctomycetota bacterium]